MRWGSLSEIPGGFGPSAVTIGNFDGVHRGHQAVLARVVARARERDLHAVAVTFDPHPSAVHRPRGAVPSIVAPWQRLDLMEDAGLDAVLTVPYTQDFARMNPEDFARRYLAVALGASLVVVGRDLRFGHANSGDLGVLTALGASLGFQVEAVEDLGDTDAEGPDQGGAVDAPTGSGPHLRVDLDGVAGRPRWSSTAVRHLLADGDVEEASRVLGRLHRVVGQVVRGDARGRSLGFPTANLSADCSGMMPADGVYAGWVTRLDLPPGSADKVLPAAVSVGTNPTFARPPGASPSASAPSAIRRIEAHVPGRTDLDLYGETVAVDFVVRLRSTLAFTTVDALTAQMHDDVSGAMVALRARRN
ncbi:MAG: bifunctional riboflavin kinase/FAD synthetase [Bifidobacteriaceae bacterium]|jgi:riboflavin kinase/FMN adenylyltransferase|nr:bifunctional riboflavin kinase/FAD synthetase [Bifidobacteriaceae bacterium]